MQENLCHNSLKELNRRQSTEEKENIESILSKYQSKNSIFDARQKN